MTDLLDAVLAAHGGLERWRQFSSMEATIVTGGELWQIKGQPQDPAPRRMAVPRKVHCQRRLTKTDDHGVPGVRVLPAAVQKDDPRGTLK